MTEWYKVKNFNKNISYISNQDIKNIKSYKAYLLRDVGLNKISELVTFAKKFGNVFKYGKKKSYYF